MESINSPHRIKEYSVELIHVRDNDKKGGIFFDITFDRSFERIIFRSDVDGLPIQEKTDLPFKSKNDGVMHACGHDYHMSMLLTTFHKLITTRYNWKKNIRFVFQRAEEGDEVLGGK